ncbi:MAG: HIT family protein [Candidatus Accumulibacter sp.]|nr:HIT family protein [Accumulibacter sp.]
MSNTQGIVQFREKFRVDELMVFNTPAWSWSVRPSQPTLGASVISLNRHAASFSEVSAAEMSELAEVVARLETALKTAFAYDRINYLMLMMVDHQVHFHVIPRYETSRQFAGLEWGDSGWPSFPALADCQHQEATLPLIRDALKATQTN